MSEPVEGPAGPQGPIGPQGAIGPPGNGNGEPGPKGEKGDPGGVESKVKRTFWAVVAVATLVTTLMFYAINENRQLLERMQAAEAKAIEAHDVQCILRADLTRRAANTRAYIKDVEAGNRQLIEGISINDLRRSLAGNEATLKALMLLDCT